MIGTVLDERYEIVGKLGQGGMGTVYEALHVGMGRRLAVKVITAEDFTKKPSILKRFQREARATAAIETQHIVEVIDTGTDPATGRPYLAMELLRGEDAGQLLLRLGPLRPTVALQLVRQVCLGLHKAHQGGVIHRDIKPANLFLSEQDEGEILVKILDFGVAKIKMENAGTMMDTGLTRTGGMVGSPPYMSPEQARGQKTVDHRADLWSLAVVFYELLSGRTPFAQAEGIGDLIMYICGEPIPSVQSVAPWVSPEIAAIVHDALRCAPPDRFQSAAEMLAAIDAALPAAGRLLKTDLLGLGAEGRAQRAEALELHPSTAKGAPRHCVLPVRPASPAAEHTAETAGHDEPQPAAKSSPSAEVLTDAGLAHSQEIEPHAHGRLALGLLAAGLVLAAALALYALVAPSPASPRTGAEPAAAGAPAAVDEPRTTASPPPRPSDTADATAPGAPPTPSAATKAADPR